jgi:hypothetical protein
MKITFLVLCVLLTTAAFGQYGSRANSISSQPQAYPSPSHTANATTHGLAAERPVLGGTNYIIAQGERALSDLPQAATAAAPSLGDTARMLRTEHAKLKKARVVFEN